MGYSEADGADRGGKTGSGRMSSESQQNQERRERLRKLALETIDLNKDPYFMRNHLGHPPSSNPPPPPQTSIPPSGACHAGDPNLPFYVRISFHVITLQPRRLFRETLDPRCCYRHLAIKTTCHILSPGYSPPLVIKGLSRRGCKHPRSCPQIYPSLTFTLLHPGTYECKLCLTLHSNEGNYLAHTQVCTCSCPTSPANAFWPDLDAKHAGFANSA